MSHYASAIGPVYVVRFEERLTLPDCIALASDVERVRKTAGETLAAIMVFPAHYPSPEGAVRKAFAKTLEAFAARSESLYVVLEGEAFSSVGIRDLFSDWPGLHSGDRVVFLANAEEALTTIALRMNTRPSTLIATARFRKLVA